MVLLLNSQVPGKVTGGKERSTPMSLREEHYHLAIIIILLFATSPSIAFLARDCSLTSGIEKT